VAILTCIEKPFLSISVAKPPSTTFTSAAMIFPETTVLAPYIRVWRLHVVRLIDSASAYRSPDSLCAGAGHVA
jgi:hypothetical protein